MKKMQQINLKSGPAQRGYILLIVALFLSVLMVASAQFFLKTTDHTTGSGMIRDSTQSVLLAESAMNMVMGQFISGDDNGSGAEAAKNFSAYLGNQVALSNMWADADPYLRNMYYVTNTNDASEINITMPSILQAIANGESNAVNLAPAGSHRITTLGVALPPMRMNDLFDASGASIFSPSLFVLDAAGLLKKSNHSSWNAETSPVKAAGWLEATENPANVQVVDIFVQAMADVDGAKSYLQRHLGSYVPSARLGNIELIVEASNVNRMRGVDQ